MNNNEFITLVADKLTNLLPEFTYTVEGDQVNVYDDPTKRFLNGWIDINMDGESADIQTDEGDFSVEMTPTGAAQLVARIVLEMTYDMA